MRFAAGAAAGSAVTVTLLSLCHRTAAYGLLYAMPSVDYSQYLDNTLSTVDGRYISSWHPFAPSYLERATYWHPVSVCCLLQGYTINTINRSERGQGSTPRRWQFWFLLHLNGLKLHANEVSWSEHKSPTANIQQISNSRNSSKRSTVSYTRYTRTFRRTYSS